MALGKAIVEQECGNLGLETTILGTQTFVIPAKAGIQSAVYSKSWTGLVPAFAGTTVLGLNRVP